MEEPGKDVAACKIQVGDRILLMTEIPHANDKGEVASCCRIFLVSKVNRLEGEEYAVLHVELVFTTGRKIVVPGTIPLYRLL